MKIYPADSIFSKYIRSRDGWKCTKCGTQYQEGDRGLHCSHFYTRGCWSTRFDEENADAHCYGCHAYFEGHPHEFQVWKFERLGEKKYWSLVRRANTDLKKLLGLNKKDLMKIVKDNYAKKLKELQG